MQSICTRHYRYSSRQHCRGSNLDITRAADLASEREERDNLKAQLPSFQSNITSPTFQRTVTFERTVTFPGTVTFPDTVQKTVSSSYVADYNRSIDHLASGTTAFMGGL
jgi:hypothetical protein